MLSRIDWKNAAFSFVISGLLLWYFIHEGFLYRFLNSDMSHIAWTVAFIYPFVMLIHIIMPSLNPHGFPVRFAGFYENTIPYVGLLGTLIGFYRSISALVILDINAENIHAILKAIAGGFFIDIVSSITAITIFIILKFHRFLSYKKV